MSIALTKKGDKDTVYNLALRFPKALSTRGLEREMGGSKAKVIWGRRAAKKWQQCATTSLNLFVEKYDRKSQRLRLSICWGILEIASNHILCHLFNYTQTNFGTSLTNHHVSSHF